MSTWRDALRALLKDSQLLFDEPMDRHTTFRVGGPADALAFPQTIGEFTAVLAFAQREHLPALVIGNGSNLLVRDGGIRGVVVSTLKLNDIAIEKNRLRAQAGASLARVAQAAMAAGLSGLEFVGGIPGTMGGAVAMNAGAYGGEISHCLSNGSVWLDGQIRHYMAQDFALGYRESSVQKNGGIVLDAEFELKKDDPEAIGARMREMNAKRREKQPLEFPSAGSTFKRPEGHFAGGLIEQAGLKGKAINGAQVSEKHAGFIVNTGGATAKDLLALIELVQNTVEAMSGVRLECEVRVVGEG